MLIRSPSASITTLNLNCPIGRDMCTPVISGVTDFSFQNALSGLSLSVMSLVWYEWGGRIDFSVLFYLLFPCSHIKMTSYMFNLGCCRFNSP